MPTTSSLFAPTLTASSGKLNSGFALDFIVTFRLNLVLIVLRKKEKIVWNKSLILKQRKFTNQNMSIN